MAAFVEAVRPELLRASDKEIEQALEHADPMVLRGLLYQLTGDPEVNATRLREAPAGSPQVAALASGDDEALLRHKAAEYLKAYRGAGAGPVGDGPPERLRESMDLVVGHEIKDYARDLMVEELALDPWARSLKWQSAPDAAQLENFSVTIIGAGMGGLNAALQLKRAGIEFRVIEKNSQVGGTWYENRYPGARVDTPSRSYMNIFSVNFPFPQPFGEHKENQKYFEWVADEFGLRENITFETSVRSLTWDEATSMWEICVDGPEGEEVLFSNAIISGVGFLNRPSIPEFEGAADFKGQSWHTARWPEKADLRGKRIAVIGTGCTGYQMIPELAQLEGAHVTVFQRTPQWMFPLPGYKSPSPPELLWLDRNLPLHTNFMRFKLFYGSGPDFVKMFDIDPDFDDPFSCSAPNKAARDRSIEFLKSKLTDPDLIETMTPNHPPWSSRPVAVDADDSILDVLEGDDITLVAQGVNRINANGLEAEDGTQHDVDIIVYATGFKASEFLYPMTITGKDGKTIEELWADDGARAYLGCMMPGFPNLWALYGPNTNGGLPVSQFHEMTMVYAMQCMEKLILNGKKSVDVREEAYWRYNRLVDKLNAKKIWADPRAQNYWWTKHGRTSSQIPFTGYEVRENLLRPDFADLEVK